MKEYIAHVREFNGEIQTVLQHVSETARFSGIFSKKIGSKEIGELIGLLHDLGKFSTEFYNYISSATGIINEDDDAENYVDYKKKKGKVDHSTAGAQLFQELFSTKFDTPDKKQELFNIIVNLTVVSHHSGLIDCMDILGANVYQNRLAKNEEYTHWNEVKNNLPPQLLQRIRELIDNISIMSFLEEKLLFAKAQNKPLFHLGLLARILLSCLLDADRISTADFDLPDKKWHRSIYYNNDINLLWGILAEKLDLSIENFKNKPFQTAKNKKLNEIRNEISDACFEFANKKNNIYQLTVPTGGGKTLASLRFALKHAQKNAMQKIIYIVPYTSIIDQNAKVAREIFEDEASFGDIVLEHHSNLMSEQETAKQKILAENWDAPIIFTTMVQFLNTLFASGTKSARRMHQLANAIIIIDEIQALPIRCVHLFTGAIKFLVGSCTSTVVLCSATQPLLDRLPFEKHSLKIDVSQKIFTVKDKLFEQLRRVDVEDCCRNGGWDIASVAQLAIEKATKFNSVLIIANTKSIAKEVFSELKQFSSYKIFHLSTNMCPKHRMDILGELKNALATAVEPIICVSTQLIEAGVDIDFGCVIRYLAGLDSIVQAAGRCNREAQMEKNGKLLIVNAQKENLDKLPDINQGRRVTERILREYANDPSQFDNDIIGEKAMERYYKYYFYDRKELMNYKVLASTKISREDNLFNLLSNNTISQENSCERLKPLLPQSFKKANELFEVIESNTYGIIVPYKEGEDIIKTLVGNIGLQEQYEMLKKAQRYSVNVFSYVFQKLDSLKIINETQSGSGVFYLDKQYYSKEYGVDESIANEMELTMC